MRAWRGWAAAALLALAGEAFAQSPSDAVVSQLRAQGYVEFSVSRTLLGRIRVIATAPDGGRREIVFSPATGEILRDYVEAPGGARTPRIFDWEDGGSDHGDDGDRSGDDGDRDDDEDDDSDDDGDRDDDRGDDDDGDEEDDDEDGESGDGDGD